MFESEGEIGEINYIEESIELRPGLERETVKVRHSGDRPVQVGCHFHFFEANKWLKFDRKKHLASI